ncbi:MAG TPA: S8 family serine peptidase, partial [Baekduia sp.]|nr:S8 family serine peptidase [Baekduia sp.]
MHRSLAGVAITIAAAAGLTAAPASAADDLTGRLLVTLRDAPGREDGKPRAVASAVRAVASAAGVRPAGTPLAALRVAPVRPAAGVPAREAARRLRADPRVARVEVERRAQLRYVPNDPGFTTPDERAADGRPAQWYLQRHGFPAAWDVARGVGARIAVIDSGVDINHPDVGPRVVERADFDGTRGHGGAEVDEVGHGTHVASLACAVADDSRGIAGAGFACDLLVAKSDLSDFSVAQSITWAVQNKADAIVMSFGTTGEQPASSVVFRALEDAYASGVILVAAAADEPVEEQGDPANVLQPTGTGANLDAGRGLSVTAAGDDDRRAPFAGRGSQISLAAYGTLRSGSRDGLLAAFPGQTTDIERGSLFGPAPCNCRQPFAGDSRYAYLQGTSMSAPVVAGAAALVRRLNPDLTLAEVLRLMKETARNQNWDPETGWGVMDAAQAIAQARVMDRRPPRSRA